MVGGWALTGTGETIVGEGLKGRDCWGGGKGRDWADGGGGEDCKGVGREGGLGGSRNLPLGHGGSPSRGSILERQHLSFQPGPSLRGMRVDSRIVVAWELLLGLQYLPAIPFC